jgi:hypothetical protein
MEELPAVEVSDNEKWIVLAYRRYLEDNQMIQHQLEDGMLDGMGAVKMGSMATTSFFNTVTRTLMKDLERR